MPGFILIQSHLVRVSPAVCPCLNCRCGASGFPTRSLGITVVVDVNRQDEPAFLIVVMSLLATCSVLRNGFEARGASLLAVRCLIVTPLESALHDRPDHLVGSNRG